MKKSNKKITDKAKMKNRIKNRMIFISLGFVAALSSMVGKVAYIKIVHGEEYQSEVLNRMTNQNSVIPPQRGPIVDRNNKTLVTSVLSYRIVLDPFAISNKSPQTQQIIYDTLEEHLDVSAEEARALVEKNPNSKYALLAKNVRTEQAEALKNEELSGVWFEETYHREYPKGEGAAQLLGFFNKDGQGQYGIEQQYNDYLAGTPGRVFSQLDDNQIVNTQIVPAQDGATVKLTIDEVIQEYTESVMDRFVKEEGAKSAAAIFMNPNTGEIYSMYSYPSFNPASYNVLTEQFGVEAWNAMEDVERSLSVTKAWQNHGTQHPYELGSTFKPLFVAKALEDGLIKPGEEFYCPGYKVIAGSTIRCWKREGHGKQTLEQALANSCNPAMIEISQRVDQETFQEYLSSYGFGQLTNINLPGEAKGLIHDKLGPVEKATYAMGQGFTATPLQLLTAFASVINGGYLVEPYVVSEVISEFGETLYTDGPTIRKSVLANETSDYMRTTLEKVVLEGTGKPAQMTGYTVGGKTGTAQKLPRSANLHVLSFVGYAPVENPQIIGVVLMDEINQYGGITTRAFKEIMSNILPYLEVELSSTDVPVVEEESVAVPNVVGKNIYEAYFELTKVGLTYNYVGVGSQIKKQYPEAGTMIPKGTSVKIYTHTENPENLVITPDLRHATPTEARAMLGEDFVVKGGYSDQPILTQTPQPGQKVDLVESGTTIYVTTAEPSQELDSEDTESEENVENEETDSNVGSSNE